MILLDLESLRRAEPDALLRLARFVGLPGICCCAEHNHHCAQRIRVRLAAWLNDERQRRDTQRP